jgi:hypothetical protein
MKVTSKITSIMSSLAIMLAVGSAKAVPLTIDQVIFQSGTGQVPSLMTGTVDASVVTDVTGTHLTLVVRNTSVDAAFTDATAPASMLLTHVGFQLPTVPTNIDILSGTVTATAGSTGVNFDLATTDLNSQWAFANQSFNGFSLGLPINTGLTSVQNGQATRFDGGNGSINGPGYGMISALETQFGSSQPGVRDSITFVLNLSGAITLAALEAGNVVLGFGSPDTAGVPGVPDGGSTVALLGFTLLGVEILRRKISKNCLALN